MLLRMLLAHLCHLHMPHLESDGLMISCSIIFLGMWALLRMFRVLLVAPSHGTHMTPRVNYILSVTGRCNPEDQPMLVVRVKTWGL